MLPLFCLFALAFTAASCAANKITVDGIEVYESHWRRATGEIGRRASIEFSCPVEKLQFTLQHREGRMPIEVGVKGCGRRGLYERLVIRLNGNARAVGDWRLVAEGADPTPQPQGTPAPEST